MKKYIYGFDSSLSTMGSTKARSDIGIILDSIGYINRAPKFLVCIEDFAYSKLKQGTLPFSLVRNLNHLLGILPIFFSVLTMEKNSVLVINYPQVLRFKDSLVFLFARFFKKAKNIQMIAIIHDIYPLFKGVPAQSYFQKVELLHDYDVIISHNKSMPRYLIEEGFEKEKLVDLEIFDYLLDGELELLEQENLKSIFIAGNLERAKVTFLQELPDLNDVVFNLYGPNLPEEFKSLSVPQTKYFGSFPPAQLIDKLQGAYGLVWDSTLAVGGHGVLGNYQRYNNPHKTSLYIAAGFPVITWSESAIAPFITENNLGFVVDDLNNLSEKINAISQEDYENMQQSIKQMAEKIRKGYFMNQAIAKAEKMVKTS
jgi:hypothetical protein